MGHWAFYTDDFILEKDCRLPVGDLAVQRGYGVFDFFKTVNGAPLFLHAHLERFYHSAALLRLPVAHAPDALKAILAELLHRNALPTSGVRLTLTGGVSPDGFTIGNPSLIITQQPLELPTEAVFEKGITLLLYPHQRQLPQVKSIDYLMAIWLRPMLAEAGAGDVLYYHNNELSECPRANIFVVTKGNRIITPDRHILNGITRQQVLQLAGAAAQAQPVSLNDLKQAQEAFITSTTKGILPVTAINGVPIGNGKPGAVTRQLAAQLLQLIQL